VHGHAARDERDRQPTGAHAELQRASARGEPGEDGHRLGHVAHVSMDLVVDVGDGIAVSGGVGLGG